MLTGRGTCHVDRLSQASAAIMAGGLAAIMTFGLAVSRADAAEPRWPQGPYKYITIDQSVTDALVELGRNMRVPMRISKLVKGRLSAGMPVGTAREFLEEICNRYGLVWHFDGIVMNVATEAEVQTELIPLDANRAAGAEDRLSRLGVIDPKFPVKVSMQDDVVSVSGPPSYIELVRKTLGVPAAQGGKQEPGKVASVRVFRGRQAEAQNVPSGKPTKE
ncbi:MULTISPECIES: type III secretion protein [unclassified Mesorhizobium]|uniref:type III secretion protein n=1 Tax=unclassified Mesorhizobium TaxID=325217 RepID=UPI002415AE0C|nr:MULTISPECIES: type III secretion protein [unclassified Mesorhizobium]WFP65770.1 type III secretion protein [Mesorhizobium sp. WSM4904]WFP79032.1 type III secretion protein [Mesorhizobium sp. WSM4906]